jgi:hypothetical protein
VNLKEIIKEIKSEENQRRKAEQQKRAHVFNDHQREYVLSMLVREFSEQTVRDMRTCTSINLSKRIINEMASIYRTAPDRVFSEVTEDQHEAIELIYADAKANTKLKRTNQRYKLHDQCCVQVLPMEGKIGLKILAPHQYDVVPDARDPEKAAAYIISAMDKSLLDNDNGSAQDIQGSFHGSKNAYTDGVNQKIADQQDYKESLERFVVWTNDLNLVCDGRGNVLEQNVNPLGRLPFVDVASEKDFEFWVRKGSGVVEFSLDFSVVLSDTCNTNRLQSYAQPVIVAEKVPEALTVGPNHILFLPLDPTRPESKPSFEFATPQPDMQSSLALQDRLVSYFLTSQGIDPKTIASSGEGNKFASGLERLLAMVERFEASSDDLDLFSCVEGELYELIRAWYQVTVGTKMLDDKYNFGVWPENSELSVNFHRPEMIETESDKEDSVIKRLDAGLISKTEAIMELRGVDELKAKEIVAGMDDNFNQVDDNNNQGA